MRVIEVDQVASGAADTSAKYAVRGLTQTAALEFGSYGIRSNSVHPGIIETTMFDHPKIRPLLDEFGQTVPMRRSTTSATGSPSSPGAGGRSHWPS